jgi:hypothetical protein
MTITPSSSYIDKQDVTTFINQMYVEQKQTNFIKFLNFLNLSKNMSKKVSIFYLTRYGVENVVF